MMIPSERISPVGRCLVKRWRHLILELMLQRLIRTRRHLCKETCRKTNFVKSYWALPALILCGVIPGLISLEKKEVCASHSFQGSTLSTYQAKMSMMKTAPSRVKESRQIGRPLWIVMIAQLASLLVLMSLHDSVGILWEESLKVNSNLQVL